MGYYLKPENDESLEDFLDREGTVVGKLDWNKFPIKNLPVILVIVRDRLVAGIAYCDQEYERMTDLSDNRPKKIYSVPIKKILKACPSSIKQFIHKPY